MDQPTEPKRPPTPGSWKPGQSGNPKGRPRSGLAFAEAVRERIDPNSIIDLAIQVRDDETLSPATRLAALWPLIDRGFIKPPTTIAAHVQTSSSPRDWGAVPLETCEALLEQLEGALCRVSDPKVVDGGTLLLPATVAQKPYDPDEE